MTMETAPIRVCLVEDQTLVRKGICSLLALAPGFEVVGEAEDGVAALELIPRLKPDVVLLDMRMPRVDGIGVLKGLRAGNSLPPTLILTTFDDDELLFEGLKAGAQGFLLKDVDLDQLTAAIRTLASGGHLIQPALTERAVRNLGRREQPKEDIFPRERLTDRERDILRLLSGGYSNREIASALSLAEGTVKNHTSSILAKLGVRDRTRAVLKALEIGYL